MTLPGGAGVREWTEQVAASGVTAGSTVMVGLAPANDNDENDPELLDLAAMSAVPGSGTLTLSANFPAPVSGPVRFNWSAF